MANLKEEHVAMKRLITTTITMISVLAASAIYASHGDPGDPGTYVFVCQQLPEALAALICA